ncbi:MAG: sulfatase, partial [bacterium]|nr:sulfatase [bacterium]
MDWSRFPSSVDLVRSLPGALSLAETRRIDFGTVPSHDYLVEGWVGDDVFADDGSTFAWSLGEGSTLQFVVLKPRELELRARLRPYRIDGPPQQVRFELNGEEVGVLRLKGGMREYRLELPAGPMVRGRNLLRLRNVYPRDIGPGPPDLGPPGTAWGELWIDDGEPPGMPEPRADGIFLPFGTEVSFFLQLPAESYLSFDALESSHRRGRLVVRSRRAGDQGERFEGEVRAGASPIVLPLTAPSPTLTRITLAALCSGSTPGRGSGLLIRHPVVRRREAAAAPAAPSIAAAAAAPPRRPHVIIYLVDTLRADHLGCYGYRKPISPRIDAFAADAVLFEQAMAQSSWTRTAVASLFTGRVPTAHGVRGRRDALAPDAVTLAEILSDAGYDTAAFVTNGNVGAACGLAQGFATFELLGERDTKALHSLSDEVNGAVFSWLDRGPRRERPFFLYLHTMDPHAPYAPPEVAARRFAANVRQPELDAETVAALEATRQPTSRRWGSRASQARLGSVTWMQALDAGRLSVDRSMTEDLTALYDAEIFFNDHHFGALLDRLRATGLYESSVVIFLSDHGEEFFDHRGWGHGRTLYQEQLRVP